MQIPLRFARPQRPFLAPLGVVLAGLAAPVLAQVPGHNTIYMANNSITIGRDMSAGGAITYLSDGTNGGNVVNDHDSGRQIQSAVFDAPAGLPVYNPTQAGDGTNWVDAEIYFEPTNCKYIYSKAQPVLFYEFGCGAPTCPKLSVDDNRIYMWTEFLPRDQRAFTIKTLYRAYGDYDYHGRLHGQQVIPVAYQNGKQFTDHLVYRGNQPWTYQPFEVVNDPDITDLLSVPTLMTENWSSIVRVIDGDVANPWGLTTMSTSCRDDVFFCGPSASSCVEDGIVSDLQNATKVHGHLQGFVLDHDATGPDLAREGRLIGFLGPVVDARLFLEDYSRQPSGSFSEDFQDLFEWETNYSPTVVLEDGSPGQYAVCLGEPLGTALRDLSLLGKNWGDATYAVRTRRDPGSTAAQGYWGMAIRKAGEQHFDLGGPGSAYYFAGFTFSGASASDYVVFERRDSGGTTNLGAFQLLGFDPTIYHELKVVASGFTFVVYVDSVPVLTASDPALAHASGYLSLVASAKLKTWFDDLQVTPAPGATQDGSAPAPVSGLTAKGNGSATQIELTWTNPTDPDWLWTRIVRREDATPSHWHDGQVVYEGKLEAYTDADVTHGHTYHYAVYTCDRAGNWSSGVAQAAAPMERWIASAGFSSSQGQNQWYYRYRTTAGAYQNMQWNTQNQRWSQGGTSSAACYINAMQQSPAASVPSCRTWVAAQAGAARALGSVRKVAPGGNGCTFSVQKRSAATVTPLFTVTIGAADTSVKPFDVTANLAASDQILFTLDGLGASAWDLVDADPTIEFSW